jgi:hypothetical protein
VLGEEVTCEETRVLDEAGGESFGWGGQCRTYSTRKWVGSGCLYPTG